MRDNVSASSRWPASWSTGWHLLTALLIAGCVVTQLVLTIRGVGVLVDDSGRAVAATPMRVVRFFTYFTIQSNLLAMTMAASLVARPGRDGRMWRIFRVASVVGMTVTFVVYLVALAPILDLHGVAYWTDLGFHIAAPVLTVGGWLLFGPWPRLDRSSVLRFLWWPVAWICYVLILGAATDWYPYPFLDVGRFGYPHTLLNCVLVAALLLGVGFASTTIDDRLAVSRSG